MRVATETPSQQAYRLLNQGRQTQARAKSQGGGISYDPSAGGGDFMGDLGKAILNGFADDIRSIPHIVPLALNGGWSEPGISEDEVKMRKRALANVAMIAASLGTGALAGAFLKGATPAMTFLKTIATGALEGAAGNTAFEAINAPPGQQDLGSAAIGGAIQGGVFAGIGAKLFGKKPKLETLEGGKTVEGQIEAKKAAGAVPKEPGLGAPLDQEVKKLVDVGIPQETDFPGSEPHRVWEQASPVAREQARKVVEEDMFNHFLGVDTPQGEALHVATGEPPVSMVDADLSPKEVTKHAQVTRAIQVFRGKLGLKSLAETRDWNTKVFGDLGKNSTKQLSFKESVAVLRKIDPENPALKGADKMLANRVQSITPGEVLKSPLRVGMRLWGRRELPLWATFQDQAHKDLYDLGTKQLNRDEIQELMKITGEPAENLAQAAETYRAVIHRAGFDEGKPGLELKMPTYQEAIHGYMPKQIEAAQQRLAKKITPVEPERAISKGVVNKKRTAKLEQMKMPEGPEEPPAGTPVPAPTPPSGGAPGGAAPPPPQVAQGVAPPVRYPKGRRLMKELPEIKPGDKKAPVFSATPDNKRMFRFTPSKMSNQIGGQIFTFFSGGKDRIPILDEVSWQPTKGRGAKWTNESEQVLDEEVNKWLWFWKNKNRNIIRANPTDAKAMEALQRAERAGWVAKKPGDANTYVIKAAGGVLKKTEKLAEGQVVPGQSVAPGAGKAGRRIMRRVSEAEGATRTTGMGLPKPEEPGNIIEQGRYIGKTPQERFARAWKDFTESTTLEKKFHVMDPDTWGPVLKDFRRQKEQEYFQSHQALTPDAWKAEVEAMKEHIRNVSENKKALEAFMVKFNPVPEPPPAPPKGAKFQRPVEQAKPEVVGVGESIEKHLAEVPGSTPEKLRKLLVQTLRNAEGGKNNLLAERTKAQLRYLGERAQKLKTTAENKTQEVAGFGVRGGTEKPKVSKKVNPPAAAPQIQQGVVGVDLGMAKIAVDDALKRHTKVDLLNMLQREHARRMGNKENVGLLNRKISYLLDLMRK